ncbi:MAG: agmatinase [Desulfurococcaceae archaeon]
MSWRNLLLKTMPFACLHDEKSPVNVLGVPLDVTSTYRPGSRFAPDRIRDAACNLELFSLTTGLSLERSGFNDLGNIMLPPGDIDGSLHRINYLARAISESVLRGLNVFLGGEHLITYPLTKAFSDKVDTIIVFDAHLDMRSEYMDSRVNHATFLRKLIEEGFRVIHLGSRAYSEEELEFAKDRADVFNVVDVMRGRINLSKLGRVYLSIDMDVFDPSYAPGVSNPEPFGLGPWQFLDILAKIIENCDDITAIDVVEVNPLVDVNDITSILAAKVILEITGLYLKYFYE